MVSHSSEFLSIEELVALFPERSLGSIYSERYRGEGLGALGVRIGKRLYWRRSDIDRWFESQLEAQLERVAS